MDQGEREACIRETVVVGGPRSSWIVEMIPLILYGESPKNPTAGTKAELDRPGTPSYRRYFIYRTKTASSSFPPLPLAPPSIRWRGLREEFELIFGADVWNYSQPCLPSSSCHRRSRSSLLLLRSTTPPHPPGNKWATIILSTRRGTMGNGLLLETIRRHLTYWTMLLFETVRIFDSTISRFSRNEDSIFFSLDFFSTR